MKLMIIRMSDGSTVLSEMMYDDKNFTYIFSNPMIIKNHYSSDGKELITTLPYLQGCIEDVFNVPSMFIVTYSQADSFFSKFYGSALMKQIREKVVKDAYSRGEEKLSASDMEYLNSKRMDILYKFGMFDENPLEPEDDYEEIDLNKIKNESGILH